MPRALLPTLLLLFSAALQGCANKQHSFDFALPTGSTVALTQTLATEINEPGEAADMESTTTVVHLKIVEGGVIGKDTVKVQATYVGIDASERPAGGELIGWDSNSGSPPGEGFKTYGHMLGLKFTATIDPALEVRVDDVVWPSTVAGERETTEDEPFGELIKSLLSPEAIAGELSGTIGALPRGNHRVGESWPMQASSSSLLTQSAIILTGRWRFVSMRDGIAELALEFDELPPDLPVTIARRTSTLRFDVSKQMPLEQSYVVESDVTLGEMTQVIKANITIGFRRLQAK